MKSKNISILGGGSWGTVLANLASSNQHNVILWMRDSRVVEEVNNSKRNLKYLPELKLKGNINATTDISVIKNSEMVVFCVPSDSFREVSEKASEYINESVQLVTATKGVEKNKFNLMSQVLNEYMNNNPIGILSGPNLAQEIAAEQLSGTVIASKDKSLQKNVIDIFGSDFFRVYENDDPYGVEMGGAIKNIYAIAAGISEGLNLGENAKSALISRSFAEMTRYAKKFKADKNTLFGLSGLGDLILTCSSSNSRNTQFGIKLASSKYDNFLDLLQSQEVTEGYYTVKAVYNISKKNKIDMPIMESVYNILYKQHDLKEELSNLLSRPITEEKI